MLRSARESAPARLLHEWYEAALAEGLYQPDAMALATVGPGGAPSVRMVLMKGYGDEGVLFFTNYQSRKGGDIAADARVAATLWWGPPERAVRIEGAAERCDGALSDDYFAARPRGSRLAAIVSPQSQVIGHLDELHSAHRELDQRLAGAEPERPGYWGGYWIRPDVYEFWQGRADRLHERIRYERSGERGGWTKSLIGP
ncbi:MAG: pyridoxamine 5'-phosphate oxidase [Gammaproteobacteria bacterium AqS3]|nr:pyridoxamine 5'-phosphate oxidase [Gammaproteobacteria bacterium AqS3]